MLKTHGITENTVKQMMFKGGAYYKNVKIQTNELTGTVMGATSGGGKITIEPNYLDPELDGSSVKIRGAKAKLGETATMEINFVEITADIIAKGLAMKKEEVSDLTGYDKYVSKGTIDDTEYLDNVAFVGELNSGKQAVVIMENAFCTGSTELETKYGEQAAFAQTYEGHASPDQDTFDHLPITMYFPTAAGLLKATTEQIEAEFEEVKKV